jgi:hypothetical protein
MRLAHALEGVGVGAVGEPSEPIAAEQLEGLVVKQLVPQLLELEHLVGTRGAPQHVDHLAVDADRPGGPRLHGAEHAADHGAELHAIEDAVRRQRAKRGFRVEQEELATRGQRRGIEIRIGEHAADRREVLGPRNRDRRTAGAQAAREERGDLGGEERQVVVELRLMRLRSPSTRRHRHPE